MRKSKQFQGSKRKAREEAYKERKAERDFQKTRREKINNSTDIEELAALLGIRLD